MKVLVLGDRGMLGDAVAKFYLESKWNVKSNKGRWPSEEFKDSIRDFDGDLLINCIGSIPQKTKDFSINYELPKFLIKNIKRGIKYIHPDSDCVFDGQISSGELYGKHVRPNAVDSYGISKASILELRRERNLKTIRTSIIGIDRYKKSLLSWFLSQTSTVDGYSNHFWNGITTYQWAKISRVIFDHWEEYYFITQVGSTPIRKFDLLCLFKEVFKTQTNINSVEDKKFINRCLDTDIQMPSIKYQLEELKDIYK